VADSLAGQDRGRCYLALAQEILRQVYAHPIAVGASLFVMDLATAELAKMAANAFLATKISFISQDRPWTEAFLACWERLCALPAPA